MSNSGTTFRLRPEPLPSRLPIARPSQASTARTPTTSPPASQRTSVSRWEPMLFPVDKFGRGSNFSQAAFNANQHSTKFPTLPLAPSTTATPASPSPSPTTVSVTSPRASPSLTIPSAEAPPFSAWAAPSCTTRRPLHDAAPPPPIPLRQNEIDVNGSVSFAKPWGNNDPFPGTFPPDATSTFPQGGSMSSCPATSRPPPSISGQPASSKTSVAADVLPQLPRQNPQRSSLARPPRLTPASTSPAPAVSSVASQFSSAYRGRARRAISEQWALSCRDTEICRSDRPPGAGDVDGGVRRAPSQR